MAKIWTYVVITVGIMILFQAAGLTENAGSVLGQYNINVTNMTSLSNFKEIDFVAVIADYWDELALGAAAILIGTWVTGTFIIGLSAAIATVILYIFVADLITIVAIANESGGWTGWLVTLIMIPLIFGYIIALWEWIIGKD